MSQAIVNVPGQESMSQINSHLRSIINITQYNLINITQYNQKLVLLTKQGAYVMYRRGRERKGEEGRGRGYNVEMHWWWHYDREFVNVRPWSL